MQNYALAEETTGYVTVEDETNTDVHHLVTGSKNTLIDQQKKIRSRPGYTRLGASNTALTPVRSQYSWATSQGSNLPIRSYDDELEVYLGTVDNTAINAWTRVKDSWSTTEILRFATWYDSTNIIDVLVFSQGDTNLYEWSGAVAVVGSISDGTHITKAGTTTWAQNRFYTTGTKKMLCVRTGTEYTYTSGETSTTLVVSDSTGLVAGDILVQKIVTRSNAVSSARNNDAIFTFENQLFVGSNDDETVSISKNSSYYDFAYSTPRVSGEGGILTLTDPARGFGNLAGNVLVFCGPSAAFKVIYKQITVGSVLTESLTALPLKSIGANQGLFNAECILPVGNSLVYLSNEPTLRMLDPSILTADDAQLKTLSTPIKPDFDNEDFTGAAMGWAKNAVHLAAPANSHVYILQYLEDANGRLLRFWQPPQVLPIRCFSLINDSIHGHSNAVPETYVLYDGLSDTASDDTKLPIEAVAAFAYNDYKKRAVLKTFDEYFVEGEINPGTNDLLNTLNYDFGGQTQMTQNTIDGSDEDILEGSVGYNSLAQQSLGQQSLAGLLNPPADARKFNVIFEIAREDFLKLQPIFSTNEVDRYWAITAHGANATLSPRKTTHIRK
jgi:hypothetical protein